MARCKFCNAEKGDIEVCENCGLSEDIKEQKQPISISKKKGKK